MPVSNSEPTMTREASQGKRLELRDLDRALAPLPDEQRAVILLVGLDRCRPVSIAARAGARSRRTPRTRSTGSRMCIASRTLGSHRCRCENESDLGTTSVAGCLID